MQEECDWCATNKFQDSISSYDQRCEVTTLYNDLYLVNSQVGNRQFEKLFNAADLLPLYISNTKPGDHSEYSRFVCYTN
jgi:hypothetical protein